MGNEKKTYKLKIKDTNLGWVEKDERKSRSLQKSKGGTFFATMSNVIAVWIGNSLGQTALYLKKDPVTGECILREEYDV